MRGLFNPPGVFKHKTAGSAAEFTLPSGAGARGRRKVFGTVGTEVAGAAVVCVLAQPGA